MLAKARGDAAGPKFLTPGSPNRPDDAPLPIDPEMAKILEKELKTKGDVTTILEERDFFSVFRLVKADSVDWLVEAFQLPKVGFDRWLLARLPEAVR